MTLLSVVKDVCTDVGVAQPTSVFSAIGSNRTMQEMLSLANEMAQRIAYDTREWTKLKAIATFTGDNIKTAFNLPADFKRMLLTAEVWGSNNSMIPMRFIPDANEWMRRRQQNWTSAQGEWTMLGGQMVIWPAMPVGVTASFVYLSKNCITLKAGGFGLEFLDDGDVFRIEERLLKLGMIWQWKAKKGSPYAEDMGTYGDALTMAMGTDSPAPIIVGRLPSSGTAAYPWPVPS